MMKASKNIESVAERDYYFMRLAIQNAITDVRNGQSPFAGCISLRGKTVSCVHNFVWANTDITAHAEVTAIRETCKTLSTIDLSDCTICSTCEPCPMCFTACYWARISKIIYGSREDDAQRIGFREFKISCNMMKDISHSETEVIGDFLREESLEIFKVWLKQPN